MKVFATKFALTRGIKEIDVELTSNVNMVRYDKWLYLHKGEFFNTKKEAIADAERRRERKIKSLRAQIEKLSTIDFNK